jgi:hypothetical protein
VPPGTANSRAGSTSVSTAHSRTSSIQGLLGLAGSAAAGDAGEGALAAAAGSVSSSGCLDPFACAEALAAQEGELPWSVWFEALRDAAGAWLFGLLDSSGWQQWRHVAHGRCLLLLLLLVCAAPALNSMHARGG